MGVQTEAGVWSSYGAIVWVRGETFKAESKTANLWQRKWNENQTVLAAAIHILDRDKGPLEGETARFGSVERSWGEGCCWLQRHRLRGGQGGDCGGKCLWRAGQLWKQDAAAESHIGGGAITIASLPPHASICSWTIETLAHQTPDTLNYRVGPQSGGPLYVPEVPNNREGPQAREPSKCLNGRSYGERMAKETFWSPAAKGSIKDW